MVHKCEITVRNTTDGSEKKYHRDLPENSRHSLEESAAIAIQDELVGNALLPNIDTKEDADNPTQA
ncbi:MAG: hypothetical protein VX673_06130, partial [Pseudomonadota bacterium]|nr:hypothetical protein [Pseudomonadota bacterium]